jgi:hypothetical protein
VCVCVCVCVHVLFVCFCVNEHPIVLVPFMRKIIFFSFGKTQLII